MDWPGKRAAVFAANAPIAKTLRPMREESVNFDTTKNVFIEGDNLEALKLLQESYLGKVKLIYIDPPYNTGNDFVYEDDFAQTTAEYLASSGQVDDTGSRLVANTESNGRFHSDWLSMMYPRLKLARNLLSSEGFLAISVDNNELDNLVRICCEIFGQKNFIGIISVVNNLKGRSDDEFLATANEYLVVFARTKLEASINGLPATDGYLSEFKYSDEISRYKEVGLRKTGKNSRRRDRPNMFYPIFYVPSTREFSLEQLPGAVEILPIDSGGKEGRWRWGRETFIAKASTELVAREVKGRWNIYVKMRDVVGGATRTVRPKTIWIDPKFDTGAGGRDLKKLFVKGSPFDNPKPCEYIGEILRIFGDEEAIILDFFAGSSTTAHAVMAANAADGGKRRFIMVQLDEAPDPKSEAVKRGYTSIAELSRERIRRAGTKILEDAGKSEGELDIGFRSFKVASTNMAEVFKAPDETRQFDLDSLARNIKPGRTGEDLLVQIMLDWGLELSLPIAVETIAERTVHSVGDNALLAYLDTEVSSELIRAMAELEPLRALFRDTAFTTDADRINVEQVFQELSPITDVKVL